jgi:hypothetical protein
MLLGETVRLTLKLAGKEMEVYPAAKSNSKIPHRLGTAIGHINLDSSKVSVLVNRNLASFMNPLAVATDVVGQSNRSRCLPARPRELRGCAS